MLYMRWGPIYKLTKSNQYLPTTYPSSCIGASVSPNSTLASPPLGTPSASGSPHPRPSYSLTESAADHC